MATPLTPTTYRYFSCQRIPAAKPTAVFINGTARVGCAAHFTAVDSRDEPCSALRGEAGGNEGLGALHVDEERGRGACPHCT